MPSHPAIEKIRAQLFRRFTAEDYGLIPESETVVQPHKLHGGKMDWGGLEYRVRLPDITRVVIKHSSGQNFTVYAFFTIQNPGATPMEYTRAAVPAEFRHLDVMLMHALKPKWDQNGKPVYRWD